MRSASRGPPGALRPPGTLRSPGTLLALLTALGGACAPLPPQPRSDARPAPSVTPTRPSPPGSAPSPEAWTRCYADFVPSGDALADLARLTQACGPLGGMHPLGTPTLAHQLATDPPDRYALEVPPGGACYRIFATASAPLRDLDLMLRDREHVLAAELGPDAWPVLPPRGPLCLEREGRYLVEVSVHEGEGRYALAVWATR